jgi:hypothetical protein
MRPPLPSSALGLPAATGLGLECTFGSVDTPRSGGTDSCQSCGATEPADSLLPVRRVYLETDDHGTVVGEKVEREVEHWCVSCRSLYPHQESRYGGFS